MKTRARKAVGSLALLVYVGLYAVAAAALGAWLAPSLPGWAELVFYAIAGIAWLAPLKPLFAWMNSPR